MKAGHAVVLFGFLFMVFPGSAPVCHSKQKTITISGAWALYPLVVKWRQEYVKARPGIRVEISAGGAGKGMADVLAGMVDAAMVSRELRREELSRGSNAIAVCRDAVLGIINDRNPDAGLIAAKGMTREGLRKIWIIRDTGKKGAVFAGGGLQAPLTVYTRSDSCGAAEVWAAYLGAEQEDLAGIGVYGDPGIIGAVSSDSSGAGYGNLNFVYDFKSGKPVPGITIIPVDSDEDGLIGKSENFYSSRQEFLKAEAAGRYPKALCRKLYFVVKGKTADPDAKDFLEWVLNEGQKYLEGSGYLALTAAEKAVELGKVSNLQSAGKEKR